jgi:hypothetical protein
LTSAGTSGGGRDLNRRRTATSARHEPAEPDVNRRGVWNPVGTPNQVRAHTANRAKGLTGARSPGCGHARRWLQASCHPPSRGGFVMVPAGSWLGCELRLGYVDEHRLPAAGVEPVARWHPTEGGTAHYGVPGPSPGQGAGLPLSSGQLAASKDLAEGAAAEGHAGRATAGVCLKPVCGNRDQHGLTG